MSAMTRCLFRIASAACFVLAAAPALAQSGAEPSLLDRMFGARSAPEPAQQVAQADEAELTVRINRLEAQIRQLTGTIEQLQYRNQQLEAQLRQMEGPGAPAPHGPAAPAPHGPAAAAPYPGAGATAPYPGASATAPHSPGAPVRATPPMPAPPPPPAPTG